ncbi:protein phosphatase 2C domain-containing protein [Streptomyces gardneri]|uniref:protein phosphatase 2C domain-containing protein n=1 Tax=Streptomyces gardneri TaxID=66892 RepID=UPI003698A4BB
MEQETPSTSVPPVAASAPSAAVDGTPPALRAEPTTEETPGAQSPGAEAPGAEGAGAEAAAAQQTPRPVPPTLGVPAHSGRRPPSYPPVPQGRPRVSDDPTAAVLPDIVLDGAAYPPLTVRAASVRGDSHRYHGEPRQDSLGVSLLGEPGPGELLMLAVADGVGSASLSHVGSSSVCRWAAWAFAHHAQELYEALAAGAAAHFAELATFVVERLADKLARNAKSRSHDPASHATTLRVLLVPRDPSIRTRGLLTVGDGGIALLRDGRWDLDPGGTSEASGAGDGVIDTRTAALPLSRTAETRLLTTRPGDVLVLSTDGLSTPLAGESEMRDFFGSAWGGGSVPEPADFLWQFQYRVKSYDDDRTGVVLWEALP